MPAPTVVYELFLTILTIVKAIDYRAHRTESAVPMLVSLAETFGVRITYGW
jgi:hypothetical protein